MSLTANPPASPLVHTFSRLTKTVQSHRRALGEQLSALEAEAAYISSPTGTSSPGKPLVNAAALRARLRAAKAEEAVLHDEPTDRERRKDFELALANDELRKKAERLRTLEAKVRASQLEESKAADTARAGTEAQQARVAELEAELEAARADARAQRRMAEAAEEELTEVGEARDALAAECSALRQERGALMEEKRELRQQVRELTDELEATHVQRERAAVRSSLSAQQRAGPEWVAERAAEREEAAAAKATLEKAERARAEAAEAKAKASDEARREQKAAREAAAREEQAARAAEERRRAEEEREREERAAWAAEERRRIEKEEREREEREREERAQSRRRQEEAREREEARDAEREREREEQRALQGARERARARQQEEREREEAAKAAAEAVEEEEVEEALAREASRSSAASAPSSPSVGEGLSLVGSMAPGSTIRLAGLPAEAEFEADGRVEWWRVPEGVNGLPPLPRRIAGHTGLSYRCSAEDIGFALRATCDPAMGGGAALSSGVCAPHRSMLGLLSERISSAPTQDFKVTGGDGSALCLQLSSEGIALLPIASKGSRPAQPSTPQMSEAWTAGVSMRFVPRDEKSFFLQLGTKRGGEGGGRKSPPLRLGASNAQQRDMLLLTLAAISREGWLDAALQGAPPNVSFLSAGIDAPPLDALLSLPPTPKPRPAAEAEAEAPRPAAAAEEAGEEAAVKSQRRGSVPKIKAAGMLMKAAKGLGRRKSQA